MNPSYVDTRTGRDFFTAGASLLVLTGLLIWTSAWYLQLPRFYAAPPPSCRVMYIREGADRTALAPVHFSLPTKIGFSRTVQPGDPRIPTTLGGRAEDVRFLPRAADADAAVPDLGSAPPAPPAFQPSVAEPPLFAPVAAGALAWKALAEPVDGAPVELPAGFENAAQWPAAGSWSALVRLEAGPDGRVTHVFVMPPAPEQGVAVRVENLMRRARLQGPSRDSRVKISRVEAPVGTGQGE